MKWIYLPIILILTMCAWAFGSDNTAQLPDSVENLLVISDSLPAKGDLDASEYIDEFDASEFDWHRDMLQMLDTPSQHFAPGNEPPYILMAGYMDTDISWADGGVFRMIAYVTDSDSPIESVEIYWEGEPVGVFLYDDGLNGDFDANDGLYGIQFDVERHTIPQGEYLLELRAKDVDGNLSDLWPYLTIHDK